MKFFFLKTQQQKVDNQRHGLSANLRCNSNSSSLSFVLRPGSFVSAVSAAGRRSAPLNAESKVFIPRSGRDWARRVYLGARDSNWPLWPHLPRTAMAGMHTCRLRAAAAQISENEFERVCVRALDAAAERRR